MKNAHLTFQAGNVIRTPDGDLEIVVRTTDEIIQTVSFAYENVRSTLQLDDHLDTSTCYCGDNNYQQGEPDPDCEHCAGTGHYSRMIKGYGTSEVVARNVKEFILNGVSRQLGI